MGFQIDTGALGFLGFFFLILIWIASSPTQDLERLAKLKAEGHLSDEEFERQKAKLLEQ
jgi:hypothetical protein